jgi:hypothetical protein
MATLCDVNCLLAFCYRLPIGDSDPSLKVDGMHRNRWSTSSGFTGRHQSESLVDMHRNTQGDERFDFSTEPMDLEQHLRRYTAGEQVSPKLWQNVYLAASARATKLHLVTFDGGFQQFEGLRLTILGA